MRSAILSCQDAASFAGVARYACAYSASPPPRATVDVSKATLAPFWDAGALDNAGCQHEPPLRDSQIPSAHAVLHDTTWPDQLSPHLQRNRQLQDTLMQKEEELARLQEENNKLKEFLNSSYVKSLEEKSKRLLSAQRFSDTRQRKRTLNEAGNCLNLSRLLQGGEEKRVCRNLSLEFCSAEDLASTPPLDSWILETLGLQDEDTIDPDTSATAWTPAQSSLVSSLPAIVPTGLFTPPRAASTPQRSHSSTSGPHCQNHSSPSLPGCNAVLFSTPRTTRIGTDLAFSMSLSPQSSVKTHTFPQGQAFTRRDSQGGWNFTWVPKQCS
uniref:Geminin coiled-coil domain containing n=1 Tax=Astyanax mexicanus TaxID=7994 RepID=A0A8B9RF33_ASTMX